MAVKVKRSTRNPVDTSQVHTSTSRLMLANCGERADARRGATLVDQESSTIDVAAVRSGCIVCAVCCFLLGATSF